ncbi:MAG: manganese efflux pump [Stigonema ocellatum SAG 48.90 = DSM 106950]|nr:manganese efflux pump [Stigonema ocellatum SAG 48.90 = DSM 106950]
MSDLGNILLVSVSLGLSNFAAAIAIGMSGVDHKTRIKTAVAFGLFEAGMPIVGLLIGQKVATFIGDAGNYIGGGLLILTGAYTTWQSIKSYSSVTTSSLQPRRQNFRQLLIAGFALSIDNLVVGFALSLYHVSIILAAGVIAFVSITMSLIGLELGQRLGEKFERWSELIGGVILILVGLAIGFGIL